MKRFYFLLMVLMIAVTGWSQNTYYWQAANGGAWNAPANWNTQANGLGTNRNVANSGDILIISTGTSLTITNVTSQTIAGLRVLNELTNNTNVTFTGGGTISINNGTGTDFIINQGSQVQLNGASITMNNTATSDISGTLSIGSGRTFNTNSNNSSVATVSGTGTIINSGTVTSTNAMRLIFQSGATYVHNRDGGNIPDANWNDASFLKFEGVVSNLPTGTDQAFGNVTWDNPSQTGAITFPSTFNNIDGNLTINSTGSGSIDYALNSNMSIAGDLVINNGDFNLTRFPAGTNIGPRILNIDGNVVLNGGAFDLDAGAAQTGSHEIRVAGNWTRNGGTFGADASTVIFDGVSQIIDGSLSTTFNNLEINSSTGTTLGINTLVSSNLTVAAGDFFNLSTFTCNRVTNGGILNIAGTMRLAGSTGGRTGSNFPTNFNTNTLTGTVEYNGDNTITQTVYAVTYENLTLTNGTGSGIANKILTADFSMNGTFTVNANTVFTPNAGTRLLPGNTNTITGSGTVKVTRIAGTADYNSQYDFDVDNLAQMTVDYAGLGNQLINNFTYGSIITSGSGTKTLFGGNSTVNNELTVGAGTTFLPNNLNLIVSSAAINVDGTIDFSNDGSITTTGGGTNVLTMGASGLIRTNDAAGLGPVANGSFITGVGTFDMTSISTAGTVEFYRTAGVQPVIDRDYNNLVITGSPTKTWALGAARTVSGSVTINSGAGFALNGAQTVNVKGDWSNSGVFVTPASNVSFNGTALQTLSGSATTTFYGLTIDNAASVTLSANISVNNVLSMVNGYLTTVGQVFTVNEAGTATTANGAFVNGPMVKRSTTATAFTFPVGKVAGGLHTIGITPQASAAATIFTAEYLRASAKSIPNGSSFGSGVQQVSNCEYWTLERSGAANATVTLSWNETSGCATGSYVTELSSLRVARHNGSGWQSEGPAGGADMGSTVASGTITSSLVSNFSPFALATSNSQENPLPVLFADVKAYSKGDGIQVEWSNLTEREIVRYEVERSANGIDFISINTQLPKRNLDDKASYTHYDANPINGSNFYRIRVQENAGKVVYSKILRVDVGNTKRAYSIYPNPVSGNQMTVSLTGVASGRYNFTVVNAAGQVVYRTQIVNASTGVTQMIELPSSIKKGVYSGLITGDNYQETKMFIVQ